MLIKQATSSNALFIQFTLQSVNYLSYAVHVLQMQMFLDFQHDKMLKERVTQRVVAHQEQRILVKLGISRKVTN